MTDAISLYREGQLRAALEKAGEQLRSHPGDAKLRTFLFELLCFAGEFDRAQKQLDVLASGSEAAAAGAVLYSDLLRVHRAREEAFATSNKVVPHDAASGRVQVNGNAYETCVDEDERIGAALEVYGPKGYEVLPLSQLRRLEVAKPGTLRDLLWIPARLWAKDADVGGEPRQVYLPALAPLSWKHPDDAVRLGRLSVVENEEDGLPVAFGAKQLLCDAEEVALLDVRTMERTN